MKKKERGLLKTLIGEPRLKFVARMYGTPSSPTFNDLTQSYIASYVEKTPHSNNWASQTIKNIRNNPIFKKELKQVYNEFMPKNFTYDVETVANLLHDELTSDNPQAVFAGKKELLAHMKSLTEMFYKYDHNKESMDSISDADTETLLNRVKHITKLLESNKKNNDYT